MRHVAIAFLFVSISACAMGQTVSQAAPKSDPQALSLAQQSIATLTKGLPISDVTLNANVISILGSDSENGTATLEATGTGESRVDLSLSVGTRSDVRNLTNGVAGGAWAKNGSTSTAYAQHNCWTDAAWFFPALSSLTQTANPNFIFKYAGQQQHGGVNAQHIQVYQPGPLQRLSTMDFYLDASTLLPAVVTFNTHLDNNALTDLLVEVDFSNYQTISGVAVPMHIQKYQQGSLLLDVAITAASLNTGLPPSIFTIN